ncbi:microtubule-actin cross-linking factor 1, isoforms 1 2 3 5-like [Pelobates cultripes]|uniref:Microtubule-actin cross-linking factor 1, isoforms 1 2 3 5-like n=1 Tax=Pelobates cultripes TaxID=61616 RepID=A0AAD1S394_PELCU|nr:microtubule-actin cross-linking factor 1, isoforms 1 2 3 5-like [Pelobates cultripes]
MGQLLQRLIQEKRPRIERFLWDRNTPTQPLPIQDVVHEGHRDPLSQLQERWDSLLQKSESRYRQLEKITPVAQGFQESLDTFQDWLGAMERKLADLWCASGPKSQIKEAYTEAQLLCKDIHSKPEDLDKVLEKGQMLLELVTGEEAQLSQEKMNTLRVRYIIIAQSAGDILQRLEQTLEARSQLDPSQEDISLWLGRMEKLVCATEGGTEQTALSASDMEKLEQVVQSERAHLSKTEERLEQLSHVQLDVQTVQAQLLEHKVLSMDMLQHTGITERLLSISDTLLALCPQSIQERLREPVTSLREMTPRVVAQGSASTACLEHVLSLLTQLSEVEDEVLPWMAETEAVVSLLSLNSKESSDFREQQDQIQTLREVVAEHKPLITKLHRISCKLSEVNPAQGAAFQQRFETAEKQYCAIRETVRQAAAVLEDTVPRYSQLSERMEIMGERLERLKERLQSGSSVRGEPSRIREQLRENTLVQAELEKLAVALENISRHSVELVATSLSGTLQPQVLLKHTEALQEEWQCICVQAVDQDHWLSGLLTLAERFWNGLSDLAVALSDTQQMILDSEDPGSDPDSIRTRLDAMQALREDIDSLQNDLDSLGTVGVELMSSCGNLDKPDVTKSLDELYTTWNSLNKMWTERYSRLEEQLKSTLQYQETMQRLLDFLVAAESKLSQQFLIGGDLDMVKHQLGELKEFKRDLYQHRVELESLGHLNVASKSGGKACDSQIGDYRERWDKLEEEAVNRQHQLEDALLGLGQFQNQLEELFHWLSNTAEQLQGPHPVCIDLQTCEIELAKHKVLRNDVLSHTRTVECVNEFGRGILLGDGAECLHGKLDKLKQHWEYVRSETERRQLGLENDLSRVQDVTLEITELLQWLDHVEAHLSLSRPSWGQPESTREALSKHLDLCKEMEYKQHTYNSVRDRLQRLLASCPLHHGSSTEHQLRILEQKWESVHTKVQDRKVCLSDGLSVVTEFHSTMQELTVWIVQAEGRLATSSPPSVIFETVTNQIQEHKLSERMEIMGERLERLKERLQSGSSVRGEPSRIREQLRENTLVQAELEKLAVALENISRHSVELVATSLSGTLQPQVLLKHTEALQEEWQCICVQAVDQDHWLSGLLTLAERFWNGLSDLAVALSDTQQMILDSEDPGSDPDSIRTRLDAMQALREDIDSLQNDLDSLGTVGVELMSSCGNLDKPDVTKSLDELYTTWNSLNKMWTERYSRLEEQLKSTLQYQETMQRLLDFLVAAESKLSQQFLIGGDLDMVKHQLGELKEFKRDLYQHRVELESLGHLNVASKSGGKACDSQIGDYRERWDKLEEEAVNRQHQLEDALLGLGQFQNQLEELFHWLSNTAEQLQGPHPVCIDLQTCEIELAKHKVLRNDVLSHTRTVECVNEFGRGILLGDGAECLHGKLDKLKQHWEYVRSETERRQLGLENDLSRVQDVTLEITELLQWLDHVEAHLSLSRPSWGQPESTREALSKHLDLCKEMEYKQHTYNSVRDRLQRLLASCPLHHGSSTEHQLRILEQKWESVHTKVQDRKVCLSDGLSVVTEFHSTMQELTVWIVQAEGRLATSSPPSVIFETVTNQIQEHKASLQREHCV